MTRNEIAQWIVERLRREADSLKNAFHRSSDIRTRFFAIDGLLPEEIATQVYRAFPPTGAMRLMTTYREKKFTTKSLSKFDPLLTEVTFGLQAPEVIAEIGKITGIRDMVGDPHLYAGGLSAMTRGQFLNPHIDNSHDSARKLYRAVNALYYVTPSWKPELGGNLELWDDEVRKPTVIPSLFNRLVLMETHRHSWHSVSPVAQDGTRCCVSNYYFTPHSPENREYFHVTEFTARPEQPFRRVLAGVDNQLRTLLRRVVKRGLGKTDLRQ